MILKHLGRIRNHIRDFIDYLRAFRRDEQTGLKVIKVEDESYLIAAKKLHAQVYLYRNFITEKDIKNGFIHPKIDPYHTHSEYFIVTTKSKPRLVATARQIKARRQKGHESFAMMRHTQLYPRVQQLITQYAPEDCVEISGLAKHRGVSKLAPLLLYRAMLNHSLENKHKLWLLACDTKLYIRLKLLFGPAIQKAGPQKFYLGSNVVPAVLKIETAIGSMQKALEVGNIFERFLRRRVANFILKDVPLNKLGLSEQRALHKIRGSQW